MLGLKLGASGPSSLPDDAAGKQGIVALERDFATGATEPVEIVIDTREAPALDAQVATFTASLEDDADFAAEQHLRRGEATGSPSSPWR